VQEEKPALFNNSTILAGLDLGDTLSYLTILDPEDKLIEEARLPTCNEHQRAPGSGKEPAKGADGSKVQGCFGTGIRQSGRHVGP
jgi:hypothetical protein